MEAPAQSFDMGLGEIALTAEHFRDNAGAAEDVHEICLAQTVGVHQVAEDFERTGGR